LVVKKEGAELAPMLHWGPMAMLDEMDRMFRDRNIDVEKVWWPGRMMYDQRAPAVDLRETEDGYILQADLPGMTKEDVTIEVGDGILEITAKKEQSSETGEEGYIRRERGSMTYHRRLALPESIMSDDIKARMTDGVLEIDIPKAKKAEPQKKKVDVN
jgi:HSP20 family protein